MIYRRELIGKRKEGREGGGEGEILMTTNSQQERRVRKRI